MNSAVEADDADPVRVIYWSAIYIEREANRLHREYSRLLNHLQVLRMIRWPRVRA